MVGVEPLITSFPSTKEMMCPKGIKRYLQQAHLDRLPCVRRMPACPAAAFGRWPDAAIRRTAGKSIAHTTHPWQGRLRAALRREPDYREDLSDGQVRPHVPAHREHRLQRPVMHGERRGWDKKAFGIDRCEPLEDIPGTDVILVSGANIAEVRAHNDQPCLAGPRAGRQDHRRRSRITPSRGPATCSSR